MRYICWAKRRCTDRHSKWYPFYGAKGITCTLTATQAEALWIRDGAANLQRPSLDRKDPALGYSLANCRFIEFRLNSRIAWDPKARPPDDYPEPPAGEGDESAMDARTTEAAPF